MIILSLNIYWENITSDSDVYYYSAIFNQKFNDHMAVNTETFKWHFPKNCEINTSTGYFELKYMKQDNSICKWSFSTYAEYCVM